MEPIIRGTGPIQLPQEHPPALARRPFQPAPGPIDALTGPVPQRDANLTNAKTGPLSASRIGLDAFVRPPHGKALIEQLGAELDEEEPTPPTRGGRGRQAAAYIDNL